MVYVQKLRPTKDENSAQEQGVPEAGVLIYKTAGVL